jgi:hypothetical protein
MKVNGSRGHHDQDNGDDLYHKNKNNHKNKKKLKWLIRFLLLLTSLTSIASINDPLLAREMLSVTIPADWEGRSLLAQYIHLDIVEENHIRAMITREEYKDLLEHYPHPIEVVSVFNTDDNHFLNDQTMQIFSVNASKKVKRNKAVMLASSTNFSIDLNESLKDLPELQLGAWNLKSPPQFATRWNFSKDGSTFYLIPTSSGSKGKNDELLFTNGEGIEIQLNITYL